MKSPSEDPEDKAARLRERRISRVERQAAGQDQASGLTSDLTSVYGLENQKNRAKKGTPVVRKRTGSAFDFLKGQ